MFNKVCLRHINRGCNMAIMGVCYVTSTSSKRFDEVPSNKYDNCFSYLSRQKSRMMETKALNIKQVQQMPLKSNYVYKVKQLLKTIPRVYSVTVIQKDEDGTGRILVKVSFEKGDQYPFRWLVLSHIRELLFVYTDATSKFPNKSAYKKFLEARSHPYCPKTAAGFVIYCNKYINEMPADHATWAEVKMVGYSINNNIPNGSHVNSHMKVLTNPEYGNHFMTFGSILSTSRENPYKDKSIITILKQEEL